MARKRRTQPHEGRGGAPGLADRNAPIDVQPSTHRNSGGSGRRLPWAGIALALLVLAGAWWGAGALARRAQSGLLPPAADLSALPDPARQQVRDADAAARSDARSASAVGALAMAYHASQMADRALDTYAVAGQLDPDDWTWTYYRGLILEERGRQPEALEAFTRVTQLNPAQGMAWFRIGEIAFKQGDFDRAEHAYRRAGQAPPLPPFTIPEAPARQATPLAAYAQLGLARIALDKGLDDSAAATLETVVAAYPAFGPARTMQALRGGEEGAPGARAYTPPSDPLVDAVVAQSRMRDLLLKHAALAERGGDRAWREFLVRRALQFNPRDPNVLMEMSGMLQASGRPAEALDYLRQHEALVPGDHHTLVEQGKCLSDLGRYDEAEAVLRKAVRVRDAAAEYNLGSVLDRMGRSDEARTHYERALAIDPFHARAMNNLGVWLDRRGQGAEAIALLQRAVRVAPDNAEAFSNLGSAYIGARRIPEALRALETAVALAPDAPDAHNNLGIALAQSGRFPEAARQFEQALRLNPSHANARRNLDRIAAMRR